MAFNPRYASPSGATTNHQRKQSTACARCADRDGFVVWSERAQEYVHPRCFRRKLAASPEVVKRRKADGTWPSDGRERAKRKQKR